MTKAEPAVDPFAAALRAQTESRYQCKLGRQVNALPPELRQKVIDAMAARDSTGRPIYSNTLMADVLGQSFGVTIGDSVVGRHRSQPGRCPCGL